MNTEQEKNLAEVVLRTRRLAFRDAFPEILRAVRQILAGDEIAREESRRGAERMIRDYRGLIARAPLAREVGGNVGRP